MIVPREQRKTPESQSGVFLFRFWQGGLILRLVAAVISVQPFTDEIGGHTCRNRDQKSD